MMKRSSLVLALAVALLAPSFAAAQEAPAAEAPLASRFVATNPIALVLGVLSAEYEQAVQPGATAAASISTFSLGGATLFSVTGKYRYFPNGVAMSGFSIAGTAGFAGGTAKSDCGEYGQFGCQEARESVAFPTVGLELGYTARLGQEKRFVIQPAIGAKRLFSKEISDEGGPFSFAMPTGGISVGYAF